MSVFPDLIGVCGMLYAENFPTIPYSPITSLSRGTSNMAFVFVSVQIFQVLELYPSLCQMFFWAE